MLNNKINIRKRIILGCIISAVVLLGIFGTYAYFVSTGNNNQNQSANVQTGNMALTFSDGNNGINQSLNFGESIIKTFTIENTGSIDVKATLSWLNLVNTYLKKSLTYSLFYSESAEGDYTEIITNKLVPNSEIPVARRIISNIVIPVGKTYYYKLIITLNYLDDIDQTEDLKAILSTEFSLSEDKEDYSIGIIPRMVKSILNEEELPENSIKEGSPNFNISATTDETADGLYAVEDDYGTSYYFRGAVANNYVKFGGFYWRIIRINGDGSLRIIYDGTSAHPNGESSIDRIAMQNIAWNSKNNDAKYVGYMYGGANGSASTSKEQAQSNETSSEIKIQLENWYKNNISSKGLDSYVADSIFCNDRSVNYGYGYGTYTTYYESLMRLEPKLICPNKNDAFTKEDKEKGNGALGEKVGFITNDEKIFAGIPKNDHSSKNSYLRKGNEYWTMSPHKYESGICASIFVSERMGQYYYFYTHTLGNVVPVINLTPEYAITLKGMGTMENPYIAK